MSGRDSAPQIYNLFVKIINTPGFEKYLKYQGVRGRKFGAEVTTHHKTCIKDYCVLLVLAQTDNGIMTYHFHSTSDELLCG